MRDQASLAMWWCKPLFERGYLDFLRSMAFTCDVEAIPEGTVVFPHEPLVRVTGPILQAQIIETALLNIVISASSRNEPP